MSSAPAVARALFGMAVFTLAGNCDQRTLPDLPAELDAESSEIGIHVGFTVSPQGRPTSIRMLSGDKRAFEPVLQTISQWRYKPAPDDVSLRAVEVKFVFREGAVRMPYVSERLLAARRLKYELEPAFTPLAPYPAEARETGIGGRVILEMQLNSQGEVRRVRVLEGAEAFVKAAVDTVRRWKFKPSAALPPGLRVNFFFRDGHTSAMYPRE